MHLKPEKVTPSAEPPRMGHYREYPPGGRAFDYLKEDLHVYTINDIQLLKMYRLGSNSLGEQEHPRLEEVRIRNSLTERKHGP